MGENVKTFRVSSREIRVLTKGNFSTFSCECGTLLDTTTAMISIFSQFEEQLNLRVVCWETLKIGGFSSVIFCHEPKEKVEVAHPSENKYETDPDDPDIGL